MLLLLLLAACGTRPPPRLPAAEELSSAGENRAALEHGRGLLLARCARCHRIHDPAEETAESWRTIMPRMARKAKLDPQQQAEILAYLLAARSRLAVAPP